ncbi:MAG: N-acetyltransferase [Alphaproteobacteria bacterium]|nr:N-acetyltransferase [Alphaproteobacteria bacterium]
MSFDLVPVPQVATDILLIEKILDDAFGLSRRTKTSYRLREGNEAAKGLSMVIRDSEVGIAGCISYWPITIGHAMQPALLLGPLAVHPARQNLGIGLKLMQVSLKKALELGHSLVLLVGDQPYYSRVGFKQIPEGQIDLPGPYDPKRFLYLELVAHALSTAKGLVLSAPRSQELLSALTEPHGARHKQQQR